MGKMKRIFVKREGNMKIKTLMLMLGILLCGIVQAEWVGVGVNERLTGYVDPTTIRKSGNTVKMWSLHDYKTAREFIGRTYMSSKFLHEYDCMEEQARQLHNSFHSGNMGRGDIVWSNNEPRNWQPISPGSLGKAKWEIACKKK